ncbi:SDR family NAD(P)-dependent oxidoreductase [Paenibacillus monticola]|uniref:SDR family NAD(P)-dependent oxidoreductase n=1 Tax=Paenibacillus monticola TaxID=2666075 RepID=A0A7X2H7T7_9BACL|nr:SDR family NAD(P)-dependent oxidoreductase [Paenibacillus monticola]MRN55121.1 SDR family NAD(P)-dependent oxidoreductase [Paenibacillus monticola]
MVTHKKHKMALITGANSGVGLELTKKLLSENWQVIALIRSDLPQSESQIMESQRAGQLRVYKADLSDFHSLNKALMTIKAQEPHLDVLFNNAGVSTGELRYSPQGRELDFEMNAVVPYIIYMELKDLLTKGELKTVINTSSNSLLTLKQFEPDLLGKAAKFKKLFGSYATSKMALSMWTQEVSAAAVKEGIEIRSVCPGPNKTTITAGSGMPKWLIPVRHLLFKHPSAGAARLYEAAFGEYKGTGGIFIHKGKAAPLKFSQHTSNVFAKIDTIYKQEFLAI